jgi:hypothetical protein
MAQETSNDISWAFFFVFFASSLLFPPRLQSSHCSLVVPFGLVAALLLSRHFEVAPIPTPPAVACSSGSQCCGGGHCHGLLPVVVVLIIVIIIVISR